MDLAKIKNRNGVEFDCSNIADLWHCGTWLKEEAERRAELAKWAREEDDTLEAHREETTARVLGVWADKVLDVWHKAHAMSDFIENLEDREEG